MNKTSAVSVVALHPLTCGSLAWRRDGALWVTVVTKATFAIEPERGARLVTPAPVPVFAEDRHLDKVPGNSLEAASDLVPLLPSAGVVITGHAYALPGRPVPALRARLSVFRGSGEDAGKPVLDKVIHVFGDRTAAQPGAPRAFQRMALRYERAFGGPNVAANPIGTGAEPGSVPPNLVDPTDPTKPACFGPIDPAFPVRRSFLGTDQRRALAERIPALGEGFPFGYFQAAPVDQRLDGIVGDEWIMLDGMHPALPRVRTQIPRVTGVARCSFGGEPLQQVEMYADTLAIDTDQQTFSIVWRGHIGLEGGEELLPLLAVYAGLETPSMSPRWPVIEAPKRAAADAPKRVASGEGARGTDATRGADATGKKLPSLLSQDDDEEDDPNARTGFTRLLPRGAKLGSTGTGFTSPGERAPFAIGKSRAAGEAEKPVELAATPWGAHAAQPVIAERGEEDPLRSETQPLRTMKDPIPDLSGGDEDEEAPLETMVLRPGLEKTALPFAPLPPPALPPRRVAPQPPPVELPAPAPPSRPFAPPMIVTAARDDDERTMTGAVDIASLGRTLPWQRAELDEETATRDQAELREAPIPGAPWAGDEAPAAATPLIDFDEEMTHTAFDKPLPAAPDAPAAPPPRMSEMVPFVLGTTITAATVAWQVRPPADSLTVIAKGTFDLVADGPARLRAESDVVIGDLCFEDDPAASLRYASDFAILKQRGDVTLVGHAHAPGGSSPAMQVRFRFGDPAAGGFDRKVAVLGDRTWQRTVVTTAPTDPAVFTKMPMRYERAFGGPRFDANPLGTGHKAAAGASGVARLPNLEQPDALVRSPGDAPDPACFGPIPTLWKERWSLLGTYDRAWFKARWPYFPADFDWGFFQSAPRAQQVQKLRGDESYEIVGTFADRPSLAGRLPGVRARCFARKVDGDAARFDEIPMRLDTAAFDADARKVDLVWRGLREVSDEDAPEIDRLFVILEPLDAPVAIEAIPRLFAEAIAPKKAEEEAAPPAAPEQEETTETEPDKAAEIDAAVAAHDERVKQALKDAGISEEEFGAMPPAPPAPDPQAIAASLRAAGASEEQIADVMEAIAPPEDVVVPEDAPRNVRAEVEARIAAGEALDGMDLSGGDLSGMDLSGQSLVKAKLLRARLCGADLSRAVLTGAQASGADFTDAVLDGADAGGADFTGATLALARLHEANVAGSDFSEAKGAGADFSGAKGAGARFNGGAWDDAHFERAALEKADFTGASMERAQLSGASLVDARLYDVRAAKAVFDGATMTNARAEGARIHGASLRNVTAPGSVWERAVADTADFGGAVLDGASFLRASCLKARFARASLVEARLRRAKLMGADMTHANLMQANMERADLSLADLTGANLHGAGLWRAKLEATKLARAITTKSTLVRRAP